MIEMITAQDNDLLQEKLQRNKKTIIIILIIIGAIIFSLILPIIHIDFYRHMNYIPYFICGVAIAFGLSAYFLLLILKHYLLKEQLNAYEIHQNIAYYRRLVSEIPQPISLLRQKYHRYHQLEVLFCILGIVILFILIFILGTPQQVEGSVNVVGFEIILLSIIPIFVLPQIFLYIKTTPNIKQLKLYTKVHEHDKKFNENEPNSDEPKI